MAAPPPFSSSSWVQSYEDLMALLDPALIQHLQVGRPAGHWALAPGWCGMLVPAPCAVS